MHQRFSNFDVYKPPWGALLGHHPRPMGNSQVQNLPTWVSTPSFHKEEDVGQRGKNALPKVTGRVRTWTPNPTKPFLTKRMGGVRGVCCSHILERGRRNWLRRCTLEPVGQSYNLDLVFIR